MSLALCASLWLQNSLQGYLGQGGEVEEAAEGQPRGAITNGWAPSSFSGAHGGPPPAVSWPWAVALNKDRPPNRPCSPGREAFLQELQGHLQHDTARGRGPAVGTRAGSPEEVGVEEQQGGCRLKVLGQLSGKGGWRRPPQAAGSEQEALPATGNQEKDLPCPSGPHIPCR